MATATPKQAGRQSDAVDPRTRYTCECGHTLIVAGSGRHCVYFELDDDRRVDPVMNRVCPQCDRGLPGKNAK